jgi:hypothetical protein
MGDCCSKILVGGAAGAADFPPSVGSPKVSDGSPWHNLHPHNRVA